MAAFPVNVNKQAITNADFLNMAGDFVRLNKIDTTAVSGLTFEKVKSDHLLALLGASTDPTEAFIRGMRIVPCITSSNQFRLLLVPTIAEQVERFDAYRVFALNTPKDITDLITDSDCYWINSSFQTTKLTLTEKTTALTEYERYVNLIRISHDGSGDSGSFENFIEDQDTNTVWINLPALQALVDDNKDSGGNAPQFIYLSWGMVNQVEEGYYQTTFMTSIYQPGTTAPSVPGNAAFSNKSQDCNHICPLICGYVMTDNDQLML